jgi:Protein of unknown function (DUF1616)
MRGNRDLSLAVKAAIASAILALLLPVPVLSLLAAAPLLFFLPGYAIVCATFAKRPIDPARLLVLSVGLSLVTLALVPLAIDVLPGGVSPGWWAVALCLVVIGCARGAALGRDRPASAAVRRPRFRGTRGELALLAGGLAAGIAAVVLIFIPFSAKHAIGYSEMWIEAKTGTAAPVATVGIASREQDSDRFTLELRTNRDEKPFEVRSFRLSPGEEQVLTVRPPSPGDRPVKVSATLFQNGITKPYRRVAAWIPGPPE